MKQLSVYLSLLLVISISSQAQQGDTTCYRSLAPCCFNLKYTTDSNALLIDVREFFEYRRSRIPDAINVPSSGKFDALADTLDKNCALFLYCYSDTRSRRAAVILAGKEFKRLYSLEGGITRWRRDNMPVEKRRIRKKNNP